MPSINLGSMTFSSDAVEAAQNYLRATANSLVNNLISDITSGTTSITLENSTGISNGNVLAIDSEFLTVTSVASAPTYTVTRGSLATTAAAHTGRVASAPNTGAVIHKLQYVSFVEFAKAILNQAVGRMITQFPPTSVATHNATISNESAAISTIAGTAVT